MSGRFDYVKYDIVASEKQAQFKILFEAAEKMIADYLKPGRAQSLALINLEETYMWIGKAIRDDQIARDGDAVDQPGRG